MKQAELWAEIKKYKRTGFRGFLRTFFWFIFSAINPRVKYLQNYLISLSADINAPATLEGFRQYLTANGQDPNKLLDVAYVYGKASSARLFRVLFENEIVPSPLFKKLWALGWYYGSSLKEHSSDFAKLIYEFKLKISEAELNSIIDKLDLIEKMKVVFGFNLFDQLQKVYSDHSHLFLLCCLSGNMELIQIYLTVQTKEIPSRHIALYFHCALLSGNRNAVQYILDRIGKATDYIYTPYEKINEPHYPLRALEAALSGNANTVGKPDYRDYIEISKLEKETMDWLQYELAERTKVTEKKPNVTETNPLSGGISALEIAALSGNLDTMQLAAERGYYNKDEPKLTAAIMSGKVEVLDAYINYFGKAFVYFKVIENRLSNRLIWAALLTGSDAMLDRVLHFTYENEFKAQSDSTHHGETDIADKMITDETTLKLYSKYDEALKFVATEEVFHRPKPKNKKPAKPAITVPADQLARLHAAMAIDRYKFMPTTQQADWDARLKARLVFEHLLGNTLPSVKDTESAYFEHPDDKDREKDLRETKEAAPTSPVDELVSSEEDLGSRSYIDGSARSVSSEEDESDKMDGQLKANAADYKFRLGFNSLLVQLLKINSLSYGEFHKIASELYSNIALKKRPDLTQQTVIQCCEWIGNPTAVAEAKAKFGPPVETKPASPSAAQASGRAISDVQIAAPLITIRETPPAESIAQTNEDLKGKLLFP